MPAATSAMPECPWDAAGPRRGPGRSSRCRPSPASPVDDLGLVEQVEDEALVRGAALDHHGGLGHRATQPRKRLVAGAAEGDDLGDHRVEVGGDAVALADAGVHPDARTRRQLEQRDPARRRREVAVGVLGVEPGLDRVAHLGRLVALEAAAGRDVDLRLDQVDVRGRLGDRVLDLQPGVDLEERERLLAGVVEELDGPRADVADRERQPLGRRLELVGLAAGPAGARRTPRSPSGCAVAPSSPARRAPRPCRGCPR